MEVNDYYESLSKEEQEYLDGYIRVRLLEDREFLAEIYETLAEDYIKDYMEEQGVDIY